MKTSVIFLNQPKLSGHLVDQELDENRAVLVPFIEQYLSGHDLFAGKSVTVSFFTQEFLRW